MIGLGVGKAIADLRLKIDSLKKEIDLLGSQPSSNPELIDSANLLRTNEYLSKTNEKKSALLDVYNNYTRYLEEITKTLLDIQIDLKELVHDQSKLLEEKSKKPKSRKSKKTRH